MENYLYNFACPLQGALAPRSHRESNNPPPPITDPVQR